MTGQSTGTAPRRLTGWALETGWLHLSFSRLQAGQIRALAAAAAIFVFGALVATVFLAGLGTDHLPYFYQSTTGFQKGAVQHAGNIVALSPPLRFLIPHGVLYGLTGVLAFALLAASVPRGWAAAGSIALLLSPMHLHALVPSVFRDYAKAPVILGALLFIQYAGMSATPSRLVGFTLSAALAIGFGSWVRGDLVILAALLLGAVLAAAWQGGRRMVPACAFSIIVGAAIIAVAVAFAPADALTDTPHRILGGLMAPFTDYLRLVPGSYDVGAPFVDDYIVSLVEANAAAHQGALPAGATHGQKGWFLLKGIVATLPADLLARAYSSAVTVLDLPFAYLLPPVGVQGRLAAGFYGFREAVLSPFAGFGVGLALVAICVVAATSWIRGLLALVAVAFLASYPAIQFSGRHYFHLEILGWWALLVALHGGWSAVSALRYAPRRLLAPAKRMLAAAGIIAVLAAAPLLGLRAYQAGALDRMAQSVLTAPREAVPLRAGAMGTEGRHVAVQPVPERWPQGPQFVLLRFGGSQCEASTVLAELHSVAANARCDYSRSLTIDMPPRKGDSVVLATPLQYDRCGRFEQMELPRAHMACLIGFDRLVDAGRLPALMTFALVEGSVARSHALLPVERDDRYRVPRSLDDRAFAQALSARGDAVTRSDASYLASGVEAGAAGWTVRGYVEPGRLPDVFGSRTPGAPNLQVKASSFVDIAIARVEADLMRTSEKPLRAGSFVVAEGRLRQGAFALALIRGERSARRVLVNKLGPFKAVIQVPEDDWYWLGLASDLDLYTSLETRIEIDRLSWGG